LDPIPLIVTKIVTKMGGMRPVPALVKARGLNPPVTSRAVTTRAARNGREMFQVIRSPAMTPQATAGRTAGLLVERTQGTTTPAMRIREISNMAIKTPAMTLRAMRLRGRRTRGMTILVMRTAAVKARGITVPVILPPAVRAPAVTAQGAVTPAVKIPAMKTGALTALITRAAAVKIPAMRIQGATIPVMAIPETEIPGLIIQARAVRAAAIPVGVTAVAARAARIQAANDRIAAGRRTS
jgi:hypothetical protein